MERRVRCTFYPDEKFFVSNGKEYHYSNTTGPYEYLLGALGGCFYSTLESESGFSCSWNYITIDIAGRKRETSPTTLEYALMKITVNGCENKDEFSRLVEKTKKDCSIFITLSKVAKIDSTIVFED